MIDFTRFELENGLRVLVHQDDSTPMVAVNVIYDVGSRDESPDKTGFAHLFEHLMFSGSENIEDYDEPIQLAGGDSNAFTNSDITNFYNVLPAENIETAFWLESDRMLNLAFNEKGLEVQRKVVVEEFKETCLNRPYGDVWHHLADLSFQVHPYNWPTIGKLPQHIEEATMEDVRNFYNQYYNPTNAILTIAGKVEINHIKALCKKWFAPIPSGKRQPRLLHQEPIQTQIRRKVHQANVEVDALYMTFHIPARNHPDYYGIDLLSDVLCNGRSSRLYQRLFKEKQLFTSIDCYITGSIDPGLLIIEGNPADGISLVQAENAIWKEIQILKNEIIAEEELHKYKNKIESNLIFSEASIINKAMNLGFFELLGDVNRINEEVDLYEKIKVKDIHRLANDILQENNCSVLYYQAKKEVAKSV